LHAATDTIMTAVRRIVGELRGEQPPSVVWDPKTSTTTDEHATRDDERRTA
jgi:hypothetical protein